MNLYSLIYQLMHEQLDEEKEYYQDIRDANIQNLKNYEGIIFDKYAPLEIQHDNLELLQLVLSSMDDFSALPDISHNIVEYNLVKILKYMVELDFNLNIEPLITNNSVIFRKYVELLGTEKIPLLLNQIDIKGNPKFAQYLRDRGFKTPYEIDKDQFLLKVKDLEDPITLKKIKPTRLVLFKEGQNEYYFDLYTLYKNFKSTGKWVNPYTNTELPGLVRQSINSYLLKSSYQIKIKSIFFNGDINQSFPKNDMLGEIILTVGSILKSYKTVLEVDLILIMEDMEISIYEFDLDIPFRKFVKIDAVMIKPIFGSQVSQFEEEVYPSLYQWCKKHDFEKLKDLIPDYYKGDIPQIILPNPSGYRRLLRIDNPITLIDNITNYQLSASNARKLVKAVSVKFASSPNLIFIKHLIFSRVVDKFNLQPNPIEELYIKNKYQPIDFKLNFH